MSEFSCSSLDRIMRKAGAMRTSASGIEQLAEELEEYGLIVSQEAVALARHAGRKTVKKEDVRLAARRLR
jgi:histone H3/H4